MFSVEPYDWGSFQCIRVRNNTEKTEGFAFCPEMGMSLLDLHFKGNQVLDAFSKPSELEKLDWMKNTILFPFPNRLKKGQYSVKKKDYQFPVNDQATGNAIHGFIADRPFTILEINEGKKSASVTAVYEHAADKKNDPYPFPFRLEIKYSITDDHCFRIDFRLHNLSEQKIPVGVGWHPYFRIEKKVEHVRLKLPRVEQVEIDKKMIPTGKQKKYNEFEKFGKIKDTELDTCFQILEKGNTVETRIKGDKYRLDLKQPPGEDQFGYLQVFTPPSRKAIAIEPMTCNIDAFNNKEGLIRLLPGGEWRSWLSVSYRNL